MAGVCSASLPMRPRPCTVIQPLAPGSLQRALRARLDGQLLGAEQLLAVDRAVDDPAVGVAVAALRLVDDRLQVVVLLEVRVDVLLPVELLDDEVEILVLVLRARP